MMTEAQDEVNWDYPTHDGVIEIPLETEEGNAARTVWVGGDSGEGGERVKVRESVQQSRKCDKRCEMLVRVEKNATVYDGLLVRVRTLKKKSQKRVAASMTPPKTKSYNNQTCWVISH